MIEQIKQTHRGQFNVEGSLQVRTGEATTEADTKPIVSWAALLDEAVKKPGFIHEAYSRFHNYSLGNQLLALFQCIMRGIQPGPLATFPKWARDSDYFASDFVRITSDFVRPTRPNQFVPANPGDNLLDLNSL